ncbi:MAG: HDOD domain-containing protein [Pseudomonadota bacterium]
MVLDKMDLALSEDLWFDDGNDDPSMNLATQVLLAEVARLVRLAPFPDSARKLLQLASDPDYRIDEIRQIVEQDPPLVTRVLRVVNSAAFHLVNKCTSISQAIVLLGSKTLSEIAITMSVLNMFWDESGVGSRVRQHSAVVGGIGNFLAFQRKFREPSVVTCGLLHDLGKLLMLQGAEQKYPHMVTSIGHQWDSIHIRERKVFGYDHAVLAGHMLRNWRIPEPIPIVVAWHHQIQRAISSETEIARLVCLVRVADGLACLLEGDRSPDDQALSHLAKDPASQYLGWTEDQFAENWSEFGVIRRQCIDALEEFGS